MAINCPKCNSTADVTDSRHEDGAIRRRMKCRVCGEKYSSVEVVVDLNRKGFNPKTTSKDKMQMQLTAQMGIYKDVAKLLKQALNYCEQGANK